MGLAATTVGACRRILDLVVAHVKQRHQFGVPIGSFQAVKHKAADMYVAIERARVLAYFAALTIAEDDPRRHRAALMAKAAAGECQQLVFRNGFQLFGAMGFTWENELQVYLKRAVAGNLLLGSAAVHTEGAAGEGGRRVMKLGNDPEVEKFRAEFAAFLDEHLPTAEEARERPTSSAHMPEWARRWQRTLFDAGWLLPGQPPEYGGRNATLRAGARAPGGAVAAADLPQLQPAGHRHHRGLDPDVRHRRAEEEVGRPDAARARSPPRSA